MPVRCNPHYGVRCVFWEGARGCNSLPQSLKSSGAKLLEETKKENFPTGDLIGFALNPHEYRSACGKKGGNAKFKKYGVEHYREIGRKGGNAIVAERGPEYFAKIGSAPKKKHSSTYSEAAKKAWAKRKGLG